MCYGFIVTLRALVTAMTSKRFVHCGLMANLGTFKLTMYSVNVPSLWFDGHLRHIHYIDDQ